MKILIVEDQMDVANLLSRMLAPLSRESPMIAGTLAEGMAALQGSKYDLITLDLRMPGSEVDETIAKIHEMRATNEEGLLVVVTGLSDPDLESRVIEAGAHGFIFKPAVSHQDTFFGNLRALALSLIRQPTKYQRNIALAERLVEKIAALSEQKVTEKPNGDNADT